MPSRADLPPPLPADQSPHISRAPPSPSPHPPSLLTHLPLPTPCSFPFAFPHPAFPPSPSHTLAPPPFACLQGLLGDPGSVEHGVATRAHERLKRMSTSLDGLSHEGTANVADMACQVADILIMMRQEEVRPRAPPARWARCSTPHARRSFTPFPSSAQPLASSRCDTTLRSVVAQTLRSTDVPDRQTDGRPTKPNDGRLTAN
eukprot:356830-Chlamydomonas_euryale.AAC.1